MHPGPLLADRYLLESRIAVGGVGEVWRGTDTVLARPVAVKILRAEYSASDTLARFRAEAQLAGSLSHPAIATVYDYQEPDGEQPFLVMELVDGPSLAALLSDGRLEEARTMDVIAQTAAGLSVAHTAGLVHRDIKPANLLLGPGGQVKITDFGIAHVAGSAPVTRTGTVLGTPSYLAPERVRGASATPASDLYSLGIVAYECLTGKPPFTGPPVEVAVAHRDRPVPPLPAAVPADVALLIAELTAKDPAARPPTAQEVALRAGHLRDQMTGGAAGAAPWQHTAPLTLAEIPLQAPDHTLPPTRRWWLPARRWWLPGSGAGAAESGSGRTPPWRKVSRRAGVGFTAAIAAALLLAVVLAGVLGGPSAQPAATGAASSPPALIEVNAAALTGQPVAVVRARLQQLGLTVRVQWRPSHQQAGTVLSVLPAGRVPPGSTVVMTAAFRPGQGNDHAGGNGQGNGNGHGGD